MNRALRTLLTAAGFALAGAAVFGVALRARVGSVGPAVAYPPLDTLKPIAADLWIVESGPVHPLGLSLPVRMAVVRLSDGDLLLYSPTRWTERLCAELEGLGRVRHLVAPSIAHWMFLKDWRRSHPEAVTWATPALRRRPEVRRAALALDHDLGETAPPAWSADLEQGLVAGGGFEEVYLFHKASRTLLLADLVQNLDRSRLPLWPRLVMGLLRSTAAQTPLHVQLALALGGASVRASLRRMIAHQPERVVFAHGDWFAERGAERLREGLRRLI